MNSEQYTLVALAARYWFCALMVLIAFRAWRTTVIDNRRATLLRMWSPETGCIGEFVINPSRTKKQLSVPIPREGVLGSARRADVHIASKDIRRYHAMLEQREGGLLVNLRGQATAVLNGTQTGKTLFMRDGDTLTLGKTKLLLVLFDPDPAPKDPHAFSDEMIWQDYDEPEPEPRVQKKSKGWRSELPKSTQSQRGKRPKRGQKKAEDDLQIFEDDLWPNI